MEDILHGTWPKVTVTEFAAAPFDEKLAVMGLLLSRLAEGARAARLQDALCGALHDALSGVKGRMAEQAPEQSLADIVAVRRETLKRAAAAGQNDRERQELRLREIERLESYRRELPEGDSEEQFAALRSFFGADTEELETLAEETGERFDNAFRFLEAAVGPSQELVLFVTEITAGFDASWFVGEYGCEAYFRHNKELLFDDTRRRLLERIGSGS